MNIMPSVIMLFLLLFQSNGTLLANSADDKLMIIVVLAGTLGCPQSAQYLLLPTFFSYFSQKTGFDISCKLSPFDIFSYFSQKTGSNGDNLHEMSNPAFWSK